MQNSTNYERVNHYVMESILLYILFIMPSFSTNQLPSPKLFFCILILGGLAFTFVISKLADGTSLYLFLLIIPAFTFIGLLLGSGILFSFFLSSYTAWRIYIHTIKEPNYTEEQLLIITFWLGCFIFIAAAILQYPYRIVILELIVVQLFLLSLKKMINGIYLSRGTLKNSFQIKKYPIFGLFFGFLVIVALLGTITASILFKKIWSLLTIFIAKLVVYITSPIFALIAGIKFNPKTNARRGVISNPENPLDELRKKAMNEPYDSQFYTIIAIITGIIMALIIILYFIKKQAQKKMDKEVNANKVQVQTKKFIGEGFTKLKRKIASPNNKMRKLIFDLQLVANKANRGRFSYETIEEWLTREGFLNNQLVQIYSKVRYDEAAITEHEFNQCNAIVKNLKEVIKGIQTKKQE